VAGVTYLGLLSSTNVWFFFMLQGDLSARDIESEYQMCDVTYCSVIIAPGIHYSTYEIRIEIIISQVTQ
jgi:hypothetical protein